jgi:hypothetical protein
MVSGDLSMACERFRHRLTPCFALSVEVRWLRVRGRGWRFASRLPRLQLRPLPTLLPRPVQDGESDGEVSAAAQAPRALG